MILEIDIVKTYKTALKLFKNPSAVFSSVKKQKGKKEAFTYLAIVSLSGNILGIIVLLVVAPLVMGQQIFPFLESLDIALFLVAAYLVGLVLSFVVAFLLYVWLKITKINSTYDESYLMYAYSQTPSAFFGWIPFLGLGIVASFSSLLLLTIGVSKFNKLTLKKSFLFVFIPILLFSMILSIFVQDITVTPVE